MAIVTVNGRRYQTEGLTSENIDKLVNPNDLEDIKKALGIKETPAEKLKAEKPAKGKKEKQDDDI